MAPPSTAANKPRTINDYKVALLKLRVGLPPKDAKLEEYEKRWIEATAAAPPGVREPALPAVQTTAWWLGTPAFVALLAVRSLAAATAPIMDCDETFNYWEPLSYLLRGTGMQTWEYSPEFALRSWVYIEVHALVLRLIPATLLSGASPFFALRQALAILCALSETLFCRAVAHRYGVRPAALVLVFSGASSGMFHAGVALLPSTTCMYCVLLGYAAWFSGRHRLGLMAGCVAVLLAWPFVAPMFVPMGLHVLAVLGAAPVALCAVGGLLSFGLLPALLDGYLYYGAGRPVSAVANLLLYNVLGGGGSEGEGANLYGVEDSGFYARNLLLNLNLVALLGLGSGPLLALLLPLLPSARCAARRGYTHQLLSVSGMYLAFGVFQSMDHKEERFLTMLYPTLCLGAALALDAALGVMSDGVAAAAGHRAPRRALAAAARGGGALFVALFVALSASRSLALVRHYGAPLQVWSALPTYSAPAATAAALPSSTPAAMSACVGKEWYRFPSSFFLPPGAGPLLWLRAGFGGQLPQPFAEWPRGLSALPAHMNDRNREEPSRYSELGRCDVVVDVQLRSQAEPSVLADAATWERVHCAPFLDAAASTSTLARAFYIPGYSDQRNVFAEYCVVARRRRRESPN